MGVVFDIKEFAVHDGPGIRTTVFLKGCPLSCSWCHNPEGISPAPQIMRSVAGERTVGKEYAPEELAAILNSQADILRANEGGVTFSGGEPLFQAKFVAEVIELLKNIHVVLDTSGYGSEEDFRLLVLKSDLIYYDLKLIDMEAHRRYTGVGNEPILHNLNVLAAMDKPFFIRVPLVPEITDTDENLSAIVSRIRNLHGLAGVELLPYNKAAGGKYQALSMEFKLKYNQSQKVKTNLQIFADADLKIRVVSRKPTLYL